MTSKSKIECEHVFHVAVYFGPDPFPGWECNHREELYCEHCGQWAVLEYREVADCEYEPVGEPILFEPGYDLGLEETCGDCEQCGCCGDVDG